MFKKILCIFLALILIFSVAACNIQGGNIDNSSLNTTSLINETSNINNSSNIFSTSSNNSFKQSTTPSIITTNRKKRFYDNTGVLTTSYITPAEMLDMVEKSTGVLLTDVYYFAGTDNNINITKDILSISVTLSFLLENYNTQLENIKKAGFTAFTPTKSSDNFSVENTKFYFKKEITINNQIYESVITINKKSNLSYEINNMHLSTIPFLDLHFFDIVFEINAKNPYKVYLNYKISGPNQRYPMPVNRDLLCFNSEKTIKNSISGIDFKSILEDSTNFDFPGTCLGVDNGQFCANDDYCYIKCSKISFYINEKNNLIKKFEAKGLKKIVHSEYTTIYQKYDPKNKEFLYFTINTDYYNYTSETLNYFYLNIFVITKNRSYYKTYFQHDAINLYTNS